MLLIKKPQALCITTDDCDSTIEHYEMLLKQGWNPADKFFLSDTLFSYPIRWCQRSGTEEEKIGRLRWLIAHGADVNAVDNYGNTALSNCCYAGYTKKVRLLLKHGADPTILDNEGHNCLMGECTKKSLFPSLVELVCSHGVDINQTADYNDIFEEDKDWGLAEFQAHYEHFENVLWLLDRADYKHKDLPHLTKIAKLASYSKKGTEVLIYCLEH